jgi:hypothetical protein
VPEHHEVWTDPQIRLVGGALHVYRDHAAAAADQPDRILPVD